MGDDSNRLSVSFRCDDSCLGHNNRKFYTKNVDKSRTSLNVIYAQKDLKKMYHELFNAIPICAIFNSIMLSDEAMP